MYLLFNRRPSSPWSLHWFFFLSKAATQQQIGAQYASSESGFGFSGDGGMCRMELKFWRFCAKGVEIQSSSFEWKPLTPNTQSVLIATHNYAPAAPHRSWCGVQATVCPSSEILLLMLTFWSSTSFQHGVLCVQDTLTIKNGPVCKYRPALMLFSTVLEYDLQFTIKMVTKVGIPCGHINDHC